MTINEINKIDISCKRCNSVQLSKSGKTRYGTQLYLCKNCGYHGTMTGGIVIKGRNQGTCLKCNHPAVSKQLCERHYQEKVRLERKNKGEKCKKCNKIATQKGYCGTHYARYLLSQNSKKGLKCSLCDKPVLCMGLCQKHYREDLKRRNEQKRLDNQC